MRAARPYVVFCAVIFFTALTFSPLFAQGGEDVFFENPWPEGLGCKTTNYRFGDSSRHQPFHTGVDVDCQIQKSDVLWSAVAPGRVIRTSWWPTDMESAGTGHGQTVVIYHGLTEDKRPVYTVYAHLSSFQVREGQCVVAGSPIGVEGLTGSTDFSHLHFGVLRQEFQLLRNQTVWDGRGWDDPLNWLGSSVMMTDQPCDASSSEEENVSPLIPPSWWKSVREWFFPNNNNVVSVGMPQLPPGNPPTPILPSETSAADEAVATSLADLPFVVDQRAEIGIFPSDLQPQGVLWHQPYTEGLCYPGVDGVDLFKARGWSRPPYHVLISQEETADGFAVSYWMIDDHSQAYHASEWNASYLGVAYLDCPVGSAPSEAQLRTLKEITRVWMQIFSISAENIRGHKEVHSETRSDPIGVDMDQIRVDLSTSSQPVQEISAPQLVPYTVVDWVTITAVVVTVLIVLAAVTLVVVVGVSALGTLFPRPVVAVIVWLLRHGGLVKDSVVVALQWWLLYMVAIVMFAPSLREAIGGGFVSWMSGFTTIQNWQLIALLVAWWVNRTLIRFFERRGSGGGKVILSTIIVGVFVACAILAHSTNTPTTTTDDNVVEAVVGGQPSQLYDMVIDGKVDFTSTGPAFETYWWNANRVTFQVPEDVFMASMAAGGKYGIDPWLIIAVAHSESHAFNNVCNQSSGACGVWQFMPGTWNDYMPGLPLSERHNVQFAAEAAAKLISALGLHQETSEEAFVANFAGTDGSLVWNRDVPQAKYVWRLWNTLNYLLGN